MSEGDAPVFDPIRTTGKLESQIAMLERYGMSVGSDIVLTIAGRMRELCRELHDGLSDEMRAVWKERIKAGLELIGRSPDKMREGQ